MGEGYPLTHEPVHMWRIDIWEPQRIDGVIALLVGNDENDVGAGISHNYLPRIGRPGGGCHQFHLDWYGIFK